MITAPNDQRLEYLDDRALASRTPVGRRCWQKWRQLGMGPPYYKIGKRVVYLWSEVQRWMDERRVEPTRKAS
jgi:predicted DNA-binding transcriptional regulator AlpA